MKKNLFVIILALTLAILCGCTPAEVPAETTVNPETLPPETAPVETEPVETEPQIEVLDPMTLSYDDYLTEIHGETTLEQITYYARACIADPKHNNKKHIWACQRLLDDLKRSGDAACPFYWDETEAQNIVEWFSLLRHSKGVLSGQPIILTPWQRFRLCQLYGWRRKENGRRRFRKSFTQVGRKNAKSQCLP